MRRNRLALLMLTILWLMLTLILILPPLVTLAGSFMSAADLSFYYFGGRVEGFRLVPDCFSLSQYYDALIGCTDYTRAFLNSVEYAVISTAAGMITALPAAYSLAFCKFRFRKLIIAVYLLLMILPYQSVEIPHYLLLRETGLLGKDIAVIVTNIFDTFETVILTAIFSSLPRETLEAADIDGAGTIKKLFLVAAPQAKSGIFTITLLKFINVWNLTEQPLIFLDDPTRYPLSLLLPTLNGQHRFDSFAFSVVFILPPLLLYAGAADELEEFAGEQYLKMR